VANHSGSGLFGQLMMKDGQVRTPVLYYLIIITPTTAPVLLNETTPVCSPQPRLNYHCPFFSFVFSHHHCRRLP
jgi:hypothetical protein